LLDRGFLRESRTVEEEARRGITNLREGVEQAAESVLGNEAEALRRARDELDQLADQLNREIARSRGGSNERDPNNTGEQGQPATPSPRQGDSQQNGQPREGNSESANQDQSQQEAQQRGSQQGDQKGGGQPRDNQKQDGQSQRGSQQPSESQQGQSGQGQRGQGQQQQDQEQQGKSQQGGSQQGQGGRNRDGQNNQNRQQQAGSPDQQDGQRGGDRNQGNQTDRNQNGGNRIGGNPNTGDLRRFLDGRTGPGGNEEFGPLTGGNFRDWSDRLRDVEEMVSDPEFRAEAARIRDRASSMRADFKRHSKEPNWELVQEFIGRPLVELRNAVNEELLRRESSDKLVPIDREPVPPEFVEPVRRYYERLGSGR
jgi:hypothetical protein